MTGNILKIFGRSPIKPLQKHMGKALLCAESLIDLFNNIYTQNWPAVEKIQQKIVEYENEADTLKQDIRVHLPKKLFLPVPREDILDILTLQDKVPNKAKDIAGLVLGRRMKIPELIQEQFHSLLTTCVDCVRKTQKAIAESGLLLKTGFAESEVSIVEALIFEVGNIEQESDKIQIQVRQLLFDIENELAPIDAMFLYKLIEWTGDIADRSEQICQRLHLIIAR